mmetsp:Transcript_18200/g.28243  ORF Transcript_18200/g.28243 Transcript_18200/m.28243 type:complete len:319 (+) Transcript_18200:54-1010(+)|eukprot:CAMPEP_0184292186 /NCGR_PEP_ID=MMETSP1049-20130417/4018_1 /TAXON_ID=77928 /ORGANISM="Proteomonas sulcata, Strain CCMP704" /LENGTH=318 /DNA_ID=CAMNT_0026599873 /DNA_START=27 /DNA_END=983 /DNA_ORIENTATION=+
MEGTTGERMSWAKGLTVAAVAMSMVCSAEGFAAAPALGLRSGHAASCLLNKAASAPRSRSAPLAGLHMGIGDRLVRLVKANVNDMLNKAEDPEKMLDQIVEDMQKELVEFRQTYAEVAANTKRLEKQKAQADNLTEEWLKRAKLALEKGDEEAARAALERKNQQEETGNSLKAQLEAQGAAVQNLYSQMQMLEQKISEAKAKKDQLRARAQTAKMSTKINDMMSKSGTTGALDAFDKMTEKVEQMEAEAEVAGELSGDMGLDKKFKALEATSKVDDDLAALKGMIGGSKETKALGGSGSTASPKVDDELQKMKDQLGK